jgi:hypothetical protein
MLLLQCHSLIVLFSLPIASILESGENEMHLAKSLCSYKVLISVLVYKFHSFKVLSRLLDASILPSGEKAIWNTDSKWLLKVKIIFLP